MRVLIADDDRVWVQLLSERLRRKGYDVVVAFDGTTAKMAAVRSLPDAIILDLKMPAGSGVDTLETLKRSTKTGAIPVIIVSGIPDPRAQQAVIERGASGFIRKPASVEAVEQALAIALARGPGAPRDTGGGTGPSEPGTGP